MAQGARTFFYSFRGWKPRAPFAIRLALSKQNPLGGRHPT